MTVHNIVQCTVVHIKTCIVLCVQYQVSSIKPLSVIITFLPLMFSANLDIFRLNLVTIHLNPQLQVVINSAVLATDVPNVFSYAVTNTNSYQFVTNFNLL